MRYLTGLMFLIILFSCGEKLQESVDFLEPQPSQLENKKSFNKYYQGEYELIYDDKQRKYRLLIKGDKIIRIGQFSQVFSRNEIDSSSNLEKSDNKAIEEFLNKSNFKVDKFVGDSVYTTYTQTDTIFSVSDKNLIRYYKGAYFLNYTEDKAFWKVKRLALKNKHLSIGMIMPVDTSLYNKLPVKEKYAVYEKNAVVEDSTTSFSVHIKPSRKELKQLVKNNFFESSEVWIKVR